MNAPPERILRIAVVLDRVGFSRATLYRNIRRGRFPKPLKISENCSGWYESQITAWIERFRASD
ncbi:helix-turn-helix transcriptional regulator [Sphingobium boeckii]|uniref:helix-turn-helix transcriptional regulator n=1 Tax=Sphingobium boeckii TaxID=1082345 RepID=UPI0016214EC2|nr:AlpA family phage regulatory protein [Sphingobium boeckii]